MGPQSQKVWETRPYTVEDIIAFKNTFFVTDMLDGFNCKVTFTLINYIHKNCNQIPFCIALTYFYLKYLLDVKCTKLFLT